jgi:hypothetical protein
MNPDIDITNIQELIEKFKFAGLGDVKISAWEQASKDGGVTTLYSVKGKALLRETDILNILSGVEIPPVSPPEIAFGNVYGSLLGVPLVVDAHFGKRPFMEDVYDASSAYRKVVDSAYSQMAKEGVSKILFPVGSDLLHVDTANQTTTMGTSVDMGETNFSMAKNAISAVVYAINLFSQLAPVEVMVLRGNHDSNSITIIGAALSVFFEHHPNVTVDDSPGYRKYSLWGKCLVGATHGDKGNLVRLASLPPIDVPELWGKSAYRELLCGHVHHRQDHVTFSMESKGVYVHYSPSISPTDQWHDESGFKGSFRGAELRFYDKESFIGNRLLRV